MKIWRVLGLLLAPLVLVLILAWFAGQAWLQSLRVEHVDQQQQLLNRASVLFSRELGHIDLSLRYLRAELEQLDPHSFSHDDLWQNTVSQFLVRASKLSTYISQLRWLSNDGEELARVNIDGDRIVIVPKENLQSKSERYYVTQGLEQAYGATLITPIDLNVEHGKIVIPYEVTTRAITKLRDRKGQNLGLLVVNYNLNGLFNRLRLLAAGENTLALVDDRGNRLISSYEELEWLHVLGDNSQSLPNVYPALWQALNSAEALIDVSSSFGRPASALPVYIEDTGVQAAKVIFGSQVQPDVWEAKRLNVTLILGVVSVVLYAVLLVIAGLWWRLQAQKQAHIELVEQDKAELEKAHRQLKETNQNLVLMQNELIEHRKLSSLGLMVAGVGHELNTPLGGLRMTLSSLAAIIKRLVSEESLEARQRSYQSLSETLSIAESNLNKAVSTVAQFKRIAENRHHQTAESFPFYGLFADTLVALKPKCNQYPKVKIEYQGDDAATCFSSPGVVSQVLQNLITNALDHGFLPHHSGKIMVLFAEHDDHYQIEVADTGCGIDADIQDTLWEPFVTTARGKEHTGLGLYMVYQMVTEVLGGRINVEANTPKGSRFVIELPLQPGVVSP